MSTLTAMLSPTVCKNTRILVCASTNIVVNKAARRFLVQQQQDNEDSSSLHFCSNYVHPLRNFEETTNPSLDESAKNRSLEHDSDPTCHLSTRRMNLIMAVSCSIRNLLGLLSSESCNDGFICLPERTCRQEAAKTQYHRIELGFLL
jgi:hypothetical protein